jgi:hypothetical protein
MRRRRSKLTGVECVIDKDFASELLARELEADVFVMLTDAEAVYVDWGKPTQKAIPPRPGVEAALDAVCGGSMGPKVSAACRFARATGKVAAIGALADLNRIIAGEAGTTISAEDADMSTQPEPAVVVASGPATRAKSLGLAACTAIVVGNMVGSGFYLSPSAVAPYGLLAILAWIVMGGGAICLGLTFARLARLVPATGGPYAYARMGFGDFAGFLVAWGYWISIWTSLPVIAAAFAGSLAKMAPAFGGRGGLTLTTLVAIWLVVLTNLRGVKEAGLVASITTYSKLVPFAAIALIGLLYVDTSNLVDFNPSGQSLMTSAAALAPLTMFAFLGLESATVPAGDVVDPARTIPRSTILGILIAATLYVLGTVVVMGVVPRGELTGSAAPFADAANRMWGHWAVWPSPWR